MSALSCAMRRGRVYQSIVMGYLKTNKTNPGAMMFKVGDVVQLKSGGALMTVSKLFKSPEGREMAQCTWFDKKPREHRAAFAPDSARLITGSRQPRRIRFNGIRARSAPLTD